MIKGVERDKNRVMPIVVKNVKIMAYGHSCSHKPQAERLRWVRIKRKEACDAVERVGQPEISGFSQYISYDGLDPRDGRDDYLVWLTIKQNGRRSGRRGYRRPSGCQRPAGRPCQSQGVCHLLFSGRRPEMAGTAKSLETQ